MNACNILQLLWENKGDPNNSSGPWSYQILGKVRHSECWRFANASPSFCKLVDDARLYCTTNAPPTPVWTIVPLCAEMFDFTLSVLKCDECFNTAFVGE